jgi:putative ABC transport system ATP-binding protein
MNPGDRTGLALSGVTVRLGDGDATVTALDDVDLTVAPGELVAVVGPSGAGKSSLMMVAGGLERATSGRVELAGYDLGPLDDDARARLRRDHVGIVFQGFHLIPTMTALENVAVPLELAGVRDAFEQAEARLAELGLAHRAAHYPGQLSGGEQQRVALARALSNRPKLLLADEPTGNLDQETGREIIELLFRVQRERGMTLLLITHEAPLAARCTHQVHMADGRLHPPVVAAERPCAVSGADVA